ncbi:hypothetical protein [Paraburkholderia caribensis]|uniref:hypothetical protein n=1 Tax=Paraburkholderia caribensis TaxID=75105 RepID=UPI0015E747A1|nr:hypothetical protein [Paraburkholderia caribensis]
MKRARTYLNAHPVVAMVLGWALLYLFALVFLPADPADLGRATQSHLTRSST